MKVIKVQSFPRYCPAKEGDVFYLFIHGLKYAPELRGPKPPRIRLLENPRVGLHTDCELLDEWPDAPEYWPPESAPPPPKTAADQGRKAKRA